MSMMTTLGDICSVTTTLGPVEVGVPKRPPTNRLHGSHLTKKVITPHMKGVIPSVGGGNRRRSRRRGGASERMNYEAGRPERRPTSALTLPRRGQTPISRKEGTLSDTIGGLRAAVASNTKAAQATGSLAPVAAPSREFPNTS